MSAGATEVKYCAKCGRPSPTAAITCARCGEIQFTSSPPQDGVAQYYKRERRVGVYRLVNSAFAALTIIVGVLVFVFFYSILPAYGSWTFITIALALATTAAFAWVGSRFLDRAYDWLVARRG